MPSLFKFLPSTDTKLTSLVKFWDAAFLENITRLNIRMVDRFTYPTCDRPDQIPVSAERNGYYVVRFYNRFAKKRNRIEFLCRDGIWYRIDQRWDIDNRDVWNPPVDRGMKIMCALMNVHHEFLTEAAIRVRNYYYHLTVGRNRTRRARIECNHLLATVIS